MDITNIQFGSPLHITGSNTDENTSLSVFEDKIFWPGFNIQPICITSDPLVLRPVSEINLFDGVPSNLSIMNNVPYFAYGNHLANLRIEEGPCGSNISVNNLLEIDIHDGQRVVLDTVQTIDSQFAFFTSNIFVGEKTKGYLTKINLITKERTKVEIPNFSNGFDFGVLAVTVDTLGNIKGFIGESNTPLIIPFQSLNGGVDPITFSTPITFERGAQGVKKIIIQGDKAYALIAGTVFGEIIKISVDDNTVEGNPIVVTILPTDFDILGTTAYVVGIDNRARPTAKMAIVNLIDRTVSIIELKTTITPRANEIIHIAINKKGRILIGQQIVVFPPTNLEGYQKINKKNKSITNIISWEQPEEIPVPIKEYRIYSDSDLNCQIGTVSSDEECLIFTEKHVKEDICYRYFIVSVDENDNISSPACIVVR